MLLHNKFQHVVRTHSCSREAKMQFALFLRRFEQKCKCSFIHVRSQLEAAPSLTANRRQQRLLLRLKPCFDSTIDDETHFSA